MLVEQEETFTMISTRLIGQVTFNTVSSVISKVLILVSYCFMLPLTTAGVYAVTQTQGSLKDSWC